VILLASVVIDSAGAVFANAHIGVVGASDAGSPGSFLVQRVTDPKALVDGPSHMGFHVGVRVGDRVRLVDRSAANQFRFLRARLGDQFTFIGKAADGTAETLHRDNDAGRPGATVVLDLPAVAIGARAGRARRRDAAPERSGRAADGLPLLRVGCVVSKRRAVLPGLANRTDLRRRALRASLRRVGGAGARHDVPEAQRKRSPPLARARELPVLALVPGDALLGALHP